MKIGQIVGVLMLIAVGGQPALAAECLEAVEHEIVSDEPSYGHIWVEWEARIHNDCEESYYTMVTINFNDADGEQIHESLTSTMVKEGDTVTVNKRSLVEEDIYERIEDTGISLKPEKLPNEVQ
ncbi:hypothetical protein [Thiohalophilus thiocyanatoxydans]|uniref:Uncharacterized protein n=1 Tax=Thiohalophilus thiocyanatoxydans TaxID=381308 RepID=A0A4R8INY3_9GAMM|nr:hypothetical protein [Thiohalophilus thiocyanatoxydans]TDY02612.1 hypothetical protein EDC23_0987 [Thiohalophilus thiocyanatoxydans]